MKFNNLIAIPLIALSLVGCKQQTVKSSVSAEQRAAVECTGPKMRVAVMPVGATGKLGAFEGYDVGEAMSSQLTTALQQTGCFVVTERTALSHILREQELGLAGVTSAETAPQAGRIAGAQVLVKADITEFEPQKESGGLNFGFASSSLPFGLRLGGSGGSSHVAIDLRLLDASTGEVLFTQRVEADSESRGLALGLDFEKITVGGDKFYKTPLGQATRVALNDAVFYVIKGTRQVPWQGQIVSTRGAHIFINAGQDAGVKVGDVMQVSAVAEALVDPESGLTLGKIENPLGRIKITAVQEKFAVASAMGAFDVQRGDVIRY
ncbi:CsgG/HfaB family protein [Motiliproteus sediminis]|uniref:CsgG/HfaB family protein n=1 Tax=Motiliproteus sediminis TaxID=1468178 RepID=UPI001AF00F19|nr:CsgG/HfaB family protein [Motiliproteus sediminis]